MFHFATITVCCANRSLPLFTLEHVKAVFVFKIGNESLRTKSHKSKSVGWNQKTLAFKDIHFMICTGVGLMPERVSQRHLPPGQVFRTMYMFKVVDY